MRRLFVSIASFLCAALIAAPAQAEWRRATSAHFIVYSEGAEAEIRAAAEQLERFDGLLRRLSPSAIRPSTTRLTVYMPRGTNPIEDMVGRSFVAGFYRARAAGPFMVAPRRTGSQVFTASTILFHEYTHHFMLQNFSTAYPAWFVEGYAEFFSNTRFEPDGSAVLGGFADHRSRELALPAPPLRALMFDGPRRLRGTDSIGFYANAWFLTHYLLLSEARAGQLARYLALIGQGRTAEAAAQEAFGGIESLQRDFYRYRRGDHIPTITVRFSEFPDPGPITVETLTPGEEALLWDQVRYRYGIAPSAAEGFARRVRSRAAAAPRDPAALQLLADAEARAGNFDAAIQAVETLLALRPDNVRGLMRRGQIEVERLAAEGVSDRARWTAARDWLRRANRIDPDDPLVLLLYYRSFERQGGRPPSDALAGLARAFELVPQDFELRARYGEALIRERRFREAAMVLAPVAFSAHGGRLTEFAARRIEAIAGLADGAEPPGLEPMPAPTRNDPVTD